MSGFPALEKDIDTYDEEDEIESCWVLFLFLMCVLERIEY